MEYIAEFLNIKKICLLTIIGDVIGILGSLKIFSISPLKGFITTKSLLPPTIIILLLIKTGVNHKLVFLTDSSGFISVTHLIFP